MFDMLIIAKNKLDIASMIFEITVPGTWLDYPNKQWCWNIENMLRHMQSQFFEANLLLNLFTNALHNRSLFSHSLYEDDRQRRSEIQRELMEKYRENTEKIDWEKMHLEAEIMFKKEKWTQGRNPREFEHNLPFIYAKSFLFTLDNFDKFMNVLSKENGVPNRIADLCVEIRNIFPDLRQVRNTAHHMEDRARGLGAGKNPQPIKLQPINTQAISAPNGGVLVLNCLNGTKYGCTMADGNYGEVDVSPASMQGLQYILQGVLDAFQWKGTPVHLPNL